MRFNLNVNLDSIKDLLKVAHALEEAATLQAQLRLLENIKELKAEKIALTTTVQQLRRERRQLKGGDLKEDAEKKLKEEEVEGEPDSSQPSGFDEQADRIIEGVDETHPHEAEAEQR